MKTVREDLATSTGALLEIVDEVTFYSPVTFSELPTQPPSTIPVTETIPSALNRTRLISVNSAAISVTNFTHGQEGQEIKVLGDGQTTLVHGTYIKTNTGANKLLGVNKVYTLTLFNDIWVENA